MGNSILQFEKYRPARLFEIQKKLKTNESKISDIGGQLEQSFIFAQLKEITETRYRLGKLVDVFEMFGGYVNRSFGVVCEENGETATYCVRKYYQGIDPRDIEVEHTLINHINNAGFDQGAGVVRDIDGNTYTAVDQGDSGTAYYGFFDFITGENTYFWLDIPTDTSLDSLSRVLARFHNAGIDFDDTDCRKNEPKILELFPGYSESFHQRAEAFKIQLKGEPDMFHSVFTAAFPEILPRVNVLCDRLHNEVNPDMLLTTIAHCDYHQGNAKYDSRGRVTGIFDFDFTKKDIRMFDIACALNYMTFSWNYASDGHLLDREAMIFLNAYQQEMAKTDGLGPLNRDELKSLPMMLEVYAYYMTVGDWCSRSYFESHRESNEYEYIYIMQHGLRMRRYAQENADRLTELFTSLAG